MRLNTHIRVKAELDRVVARQHISGIQYTVVGADEVRFEYQSGYADLRIHRPVSRDTTFMASSSTKVITAAAVMQLVEERKLLLDDPLSTYYSFHPYGDQLTIRHLLCQTSGIPNPLPLKWLHLATDQAGFDEEQALQQTMRRHSKLISFPGAKYSYSNISYWLLGKAIESVSSLTYSEFLRQNLFNRLGITPAIASFEIQNPEVHATGYQRISMVGLSLYLLMDRHMLGQTVKGHMSLLPVYMNGPAYGGLICTATGLALFIQDILRPTPRLLGPETRDLFLTPQATSDGRTIGMTLGWRTGQLGNEPYYAKPGGGPGFRSNLRIYPRSGFAVAWLANETGISEQQMNSLSDSVDRHWLNADQR